MQLTNRFHSYVSRYAKGSNTPVTLEGNAHSLDTKPFGQELYDAVSLQSNISTIQTNSQGSELADKGQELISVLSDLNPQNPRATAAANQILNHVQSALGGVPAAFGLAETDIRGEQPFFVRIHEAKENGGAYQETAPKNVDAIVYVDPASSAIFVDTNPGDRWSANRGPYKGAAFTS